MARNVNDTNINIPTYAGDIKSYLGRNLGAGDFENLNSQLGLDRARRNYDIAVGDQIYRVGGYGDEGNAITAIDTLSARKAAQSKIDQENLIAKQKGEQSAFLDRYKTGLESARTGISNELGLTGLRDTTQLAGQTARDVSRQVQDIAPTQQTISKQVGISAPRLQTRIASETAKMAPSLESARRSLEDSTAAQQFGETEYTKRLQEFSQPYALEASMLSESLAREFTGFTTQMSNDLTLTLQKLNQGHEVTMAELTRANQLADAEAEYERQKQLYTFKSTTDASNQLNQEQQYKLLGLGSYYQAPKTGSSNAYNPAGI